MDVPTVTVGSASSNPRGAGRSGCPGDGGLLRHASRAVCAIVLALSATACDAAPAAEGAAGGATFAVQPRDLEVTVIADGSLKAAQQILIRPKIPGSAKITSLIEEGTLAKAGDILCELDKTEVDKDIQMLEDRVIQLKGDVAAAEAELAIQLSQNEADVKDAELKLRFAGIELERYEKGEFEQENKKRTVRVEEARSELGRAEEKFTQMPALLAEGFVTETQVEEERIKVLKAKSELELAELDLHTYITYQDPMDREQKKADVKNAGLEVDRAKQRAAAREAQKRSGLERQRSEMASVQANLDQKVEIHENMTIRAPGAGLVIYGDARNPWDDREVKVGESVYSGQPFITLPDLSEMQVALAIHEADIARIQVGQEAVVSLETLRGRTIAGKITRVAAVASSSGRRWSDQSKRFDVEISLQDDIEGLGLKPGLSAKIEIHIATLENVIAVPTQCVFAESGRFFAFKQGPSGVERVQVEIEDGNTGYVVVTKGLATGDEVLLYNPQQGGAGAVRTEGDPDPDAADEPKPRRKENGKP